METQKPTVQLEFDEKLKELLLEMKFTPIVLGSMGVKWTKAVSGEPVPVSNEGARSQSYNTGLRVVSDTQGDDEFVRLMDRLRAGSALNDDSSIGPTVLVFAAHGGPNEHLMQVLSMNEPSPTRINKIPTGLAHADYLNRVRQGELRSRVDEVAGLIGLTDKEMAVILNVTERTLHRKRPQESLDSNMTERLLQLEALINHGLYVFDGRKATLARWLRYPRPSLGNVSPISLLDTMGGFGFVDDELSRIEEGAIS